MYVCYFIIINFISLFPTSHSGALIYIEISLKHESTVARKYQNSQSETYLHEFGCNKV